MVTMAMFSKKENGKRSSLLGETKKKTKKKKKKEKKKSFRCCLSANFREPRGLISKSCWRKTSRTFGLVKLDEQREQQRKKEKRKKERKKESGARRSVLK
jgi:hypothetical protein